MATASNSPAATSTWPVWGRILASLLIVWQLMATLVGPLSLPPTILSDYLVPVFGPYHKLTFGGHAYKFFAPDPGPSHLIDYDIELADGSHLKGTFPDRNVHWPRLLYHRHFMLTESVGQEMPDLSRQPRSWQESIPSPMQQRLAESYADHLLAKHQARRVTLTLVRHDIATPEQVSKELTPLTDAKLYLRAPLVTRTAAVEKLP